MRKLEQLVENENSKESDQANLVVCELAEDEERAIYLAYEEPELKKMLKRFRIVEKIVSIPEKDSKKKGLKVYVCEFKLKKR